MRRFISTRQVILIVLFMVTVPQSSWADFTGWTTVEEIYYSRNYNGIPLVFVNTPPPYHNPANCNITPLTNITKNYYAFPVNDDAGKGLLSVILKAMATKTEMNFFIINNACDPSSGAPSITGGQAK